MDQIYFLQFRVIHPGQSSIDRFEGAEWIIGCAESVKKHNVVIEHLLSKSIPRHTSWFRHRFWCRVDRASGHPLRCPFCTHKTGSQGSSLHQGFQRCAFPQASAGFHKWPNWALSCRRTRFHPFISWSLGTFCTFSQCQFLRPFYYQFNKLLTIRRGLQLSNQN